MRLKMLTNKPRGLRYPCVTALLLVSACGGEPEFAPPTRLVPAEPLPGQIVVDRRNPAWLSYHGGGPHFLAGAGDPEDFLYRGTLNADGTRDGDQEEIIEKLASSGANGIYFQAVRSHGGDGERTHNPFIDHDPDKGLNYAVLDQWDRWFHALDEAGVVIYFFFYDDDALVWDTKDRVSLAERRFFEALVNRFEHYRHLVWVIAEEYQEELSVSRVSHLAAIIRAADDRGHVIGVHKLSGLDFEEFADDPNVDQFTIQYNKPTAAELHEGMVTAWQKAAGRYNLNMSEARDYGTGKQARLKHWSVALGGAYVMVLLMDVANTDLSDLRDLGRLRYFMESTDFHRSAPHDELAAAGTQYVLARPGQSYIAYASSIDAGGYLGIKDMINGEYRSHFFNPVDGREVFGTIRTTEGENTWKIPDGWQGEVALFLYRNDGQESDVPGVDVESQVSRKPATVSNTAEVSKKATGNEAPSIKDSAIELRIDTRFTVSLTMDDPDGPGPYTFKVVEKPEHGRLTGEGNDLTYVPDRGFTGHDRFLWRVSDAIDTSNTATVSIRVYE